jgi:hypothetical protein
MGSKKSASELLAFLDYVGAKGLSPLATVQSKKAAANKVFGILSPEEADDVTALNLDEVMSRFSNLRGKEYTPDSLRTYHSRVSRALDDFKSYLENPMAFKPSGGTRQRLTKDVPRPVEKEPAPTASLQASAPAASVSIIPIQIRADLIVRVQGLPFDLTKSEAQRLANVILALAAD